MKEVHLIKSIYKCWMLWEIIHFLIAVRCAIWVISRDRHHRRRSPSRQFQSKGSSFNLACLVLSWLEYDDMGAVWLSARHSIASRKPFTWCIAFATINNYDMMREVNWIRNALDGLRLSESASGVVYRMNQTDERQPPRKQQNNLQSKRFLFDLVEFKCQMPVCFF